MDEKYPDPSVLRQSGKTETANKLTKPQVPLSHQEFMASLEDVGVRVRQDEPAIVGEYVPQIAKRRMDSTGPLAEPTLIGEAVDDVLLNTMRNLQLLTPGVGVPITTLTGTPKSIPSEFEKLWDGSAVAAGITKKDMQDAAASRGHMLVAPDTCSYHMEVDFAGVADKIEKAMQPYVGRNLTPELISEIAATLHTADASPRISIAGQDYTLYMKKREEELAFQTQLHESLHQDTLAINGVALDSKTTFENDDPLPIIVEKH